jgi:iron complex transport system ATP-binding protein
VDVVTFSGAQVVIAGRRVLGPITLRIEAGQRWAVFGANGSGKTTLLRLAGAIRQPSSGRVTVLGGRVGRVDLRAVRERIAFVGHAVSDDIAGGLGVRDVVLTGKRRTLVPWLQEYDGSDRLRADELLERFGLARVANQGFAACSQGERQRVLLARALFSTPDLLLLDEPAAGLDLPAREALIGALDTAGELADVPTILVTHHLEELPTAFSNAALLRGGRLIAAGPLERVLTDELVGECFGLPLSFRRVDGRWVATARR